MIEAPPQRRGFNRKSLVEKLKIVVLFALIAALIYKSQPKPLLFGIGSVLTLVGIAIRIWAAGHLTRDQRLAVSGPYAYTRNPFYLGRFCILIGFALMSGLQNLVVWAIFLLSLGFFFLGYMPRKERREGGRLEELFGDQFRQYRKNVPSLFPRPTPYRDPFTAEKRPWSRDLFFFGTATGFTGNKELPTSVATLLLIALFFVRLVTLNP